MGSLLGICRLVLKRSANNVRLLLATFVGLVIAVSLVSAIPLYTHGTLERLLQTRLSAIEKRPAGTVWVRTLLDSPDATAIDQYRRLNEYITTNATGIIGLPLKQQQLRYLAADVYVLWPAGQEGNIPQSERRYGYVAFYEDMSKHIQIVEGTDVPPGKVADDEDVPVIMSTSTADELHLKVGQRLIYTDVEKYNPAGVTLKIVGIWEATHPDDPYWLYDPYLFSNTLFTTEENIAEVIAVKLPKAPHEFSWYLLFDHTEIHSTNSARVLGGLQYLDTRVSLLGENTRLANPNLQMVLAEFERRAFLLNILLFTLSVPMVAVVLYYIGTSIGMVLEKQRSEIALLKSRGASTWQVIGIYLLEGLMMGGLAFVIGPLVGSGIAQLIGHAYGFMQFAHRPPLPIFMNEQTLQYAGGAVVLAIAASLFPAIGAARHSIVSYKQEAARSNRQPLWQRFFVDIALLAIAAYGYNMLRDRQSILTLGKDEQLLIDPLLLIVPSLFIFGMALLFLRIFPLLTAGVAWLANLTGAPSLTLALRQVSRLPIQYSSLVLLLILTLALGSYSASAAHTIDRNFAERVRYESPADLELWEAWEYNEEEKTFYAPPFQVHYVPGVIEATQFKAFKVVPRIGRSSDEIDLLAIQRLEYPSIGWWRSDFSDKSLGALMNALGSSEAATIVSREFLENNQLRVGDTYTVMFEGMPVDFHIAEVVDYFPTLYPEKKPFVVANLDYIYDHIGMQPYRVWLKVEPDVKSADIVEAIRDREVKVVSIKDSRVMVNQGRTDPQRTGLFGTLTVGFAVAALLTVLGFFLYSFLSFQRRLVQMGILRAMGLSVRQLFALLISEQIYLIILGVVCGTGLGVLAGSLFIPFLQVGAEGQTPRFIVQTAWGDITRIYIVLGLMLLVGLIATASLIRRMKLYQTVKMGEEQ